MAETRRAPRTPLTYVLRVIVIAYLGLLVAWPVVLVAWNAFYVPDIGFTTEAFTAIFNDPQMMHAIQLTCVAAVVATLINLLFGVSISLLLVRTEFPGKRILSAMIDLPLSVSPIGHQP